MAKRLVNMRLEPSLIEDLTALAAIHNKTRTGVVETLVSKAAERDRVRVNNWKQDFADSLKDVGQEGSEI